jgi:hypothetical protein
LIPARSPDIRAAGSLAVVSKELPLGRDDVQRCRMARVTVPATPEPVPESTTA